jgi:FkbM family methyltransferase
MMGQNDVEEIMGNIKNQVQDTSIPGEITTKNIISFASLTYQKKLSELDAKNTECVVDLDTIVSKEQNLLNSKRSTNPHFDQYLLQANLTYDIQTTNKIETSKPKWIQKWVLKFRNIIQNEIRFTLNPIVDKQIKFNINITRSVNSITQPTNLISIYHAYHYYLKRDPTHTELVQWGHPDYESEPVYRRFEKIRLSDEAKKVLNDDLSSKGITMYGDTLCYAKVDDQLLHFNLGDRNYLEPFSNDRMYEPNNTKFLKSNLKKGMNVINVGANIGYFTLLAAREVGPEGKVFAFEPFPKTVALLQKNIDSNKYENVTVVPMAVSDKKELSYLSLKTDSGYNFVSSTRSAEYESIEITTTTLDDHYDVRLKLDFAIIDAEGYEPRVIEGMKNILDKNPKIQIITEYNPHTLKAAGSSDEQFLEKLELLGLDIQIVSEDGTLKKYFKDDLLEIKYPNTATLFLTKSQT